MARMWWCYTHQIPGDYMTTQFKDMAFDDAIFVQHKRQTDIGGYAVEVGELRHNIHIQGFLRLADKPQRLSWLKANICDECHWEPMKGKPEESVTYIEKKPMAGPWFYPSKSHCVSKKGQRTDLDDAFALFDREGLQSVIDEFPKILLQYPNFESIAKKRGIKYTPFNGPLRTWQRWFVNQVKENNNDRVVHWLYDAQGNIGKSKLCHFLRDQNYVQLSGPVVNMAYMFDPKCDGVLFDITRTQVDMMDHIYQFAEQIKNGYIISGKYHTCSLKFEPKTVIILANFAPDPSKWSSDRYCIYTTHFPRINGEISRAFCAFSTHKGTFTQEFHALSRVLTQDQAKISQEDPITGPFSIETIEAGPHEVAQLQTGN